VCGGGWWLVAGVCWWLVAGGWLSWGDKAQLIGLNRHEWLHSGSLLDAMPAALDGHKARHTVESTEWTRAGGGRAGRVLGGSSVPREGRGYFQPGFIMMHRFSTGC
jgi:hypothetical protein